MRSDRPAPGSPAPGSPALGSGALGSGALGSWALGSGALGSGALGSGALGSWQDTAARRRIVSFVESVVQPGTATYLPAEERVAVFDNDGTLWCEKPVPVQVDFLFRRLAAMLERDPALASRQPWKAVAAKDFGWLGGAITKHYHGDDSDLRLMAGGLLSAYEGTDVEEFASVAATFLRTASHPSLGRPYLACAYLPMIELLDYLAANGFTCYVATGGGRDFLRAVSQELYAIPRERVIGSSVALAYREDGDHCGVVHTAEVDVVDDGPAKPVRIWTHTGRRPVLAAGNTDGDLPMLRFTGGPGRPGLRLLVLHDDAEREFDYVEGAEKALDRARAEDWLVISVRNDWATVFAAAPGHDPA